MTLFVGCLSPHSSGAHGDKRTSEQYASEIALNITHVHLCNTSRIIFIDNGGGVSDIQTT